jgi:AraC-like DNA-binding protein
MPLTGIIQEQRIEYARQLLIQTRMSVKEICYKSGFSNHSTFYKQFAEKHGCTPRKYREQMTEQKKESDEEK